LNNELAHARPTMQCISLVRYIPVTVLSYILPVTELVVLTHYNSTHKNGAVQWPFRTDLKTTLDLDTWQ